MGRRPLPKAASLASASPAMRKVVIVATVAAASASPLLPGKDPSKNPEKLDKEDKDQFGPGGPLIPPMCQDNKKYTSPVEMGVLNSMWKKNSDSDCLGFLFFDQAGGLVACRCLSLRLLPAPLPTDGLRLALCCAGCLLACLPAGSTDGAMDGLLGRLPRSPTACGQPSS